MRMSCGQPVVGRNQLIPTPAEPHPRPAAPHPHLALPRLDPLPHLSLPHLSFSLTSLPHLYLSLIDPRIHRWTA